MRAVEIVALILVLATIATLIFTNQPSTPTFNITPDPAHGFWP